jgi:hypothetical protein
MSNKNYPNSFGGIRYGDFCQMPNNLTNLSFRVPKIVTEERKLVCYNCKTKLINPENKNSTLGHCCDEQNDKIEYPNLITPDYKFASDIATRELNKDVLNSRGLLIL